MSKTDNVEQTGKPFKQMKILLICTIGCTIIIGLPIIQMNKLLKWFAKLFQVNGLIMEWAMLLGVLFSFHLSLSSISRPLFSQLKMETIQFLIDLK